MGSKKEVSFTIGGELKTLSQFSSDSRYLICVTGPTIKMFSVETAKQVRTLCGHENEITGIALNPLDPFHQIFSCSLDRTLRLWNYHDALLVKTIPFEKPITSFCLLCVDGQATIFLSLYDKESKESQIVSYNPLTETHGELFSCTGELKLKSSKEGRLVVAYHMQHIYVFRETEFVAKMTHLRDIASLAVHMTDNTLAFCDSRGKILFCTVSKSNVKIVASYHWHASPASALEFGAEGNVLISGGREEVLLFWYPHTNKREFIPRIGDTEITQLTVSPSGSYYAIHFQNNTIAVLNLQTKSFAMVLQGISHVNTPENKFSLAYSPSLKALAYPGQDSTVQFFSVSADRVVASVQVGSKASRLRARVSKPAQVNHLAFSNCGKWMVTCDIKTLMNELHNTLTFWELKSKQFIKNTVAETAHIGKVTTLIFHPSSDICLCGNEKGYFKIFEPIKSNGSDHSLTWACTFTGTYQPRPITSGCFSQDGSIFALAFQNVITLWGPSFGTFRAKLTYDCTEPVQQMAFLTNSPHLIAITKTRLCLWNLLSYSLEWHLQMDIGNAILAADPTSNRFALSYLGPQSLVAIFHGTSITPTRVWESPATTPHKIIFFPNEQNQHVLYYLDDKRQFFHCKLGVDGKTKRPQPNEAPLEGSATYSQLRIEGLAKVKQLNQDQDEDLRQIGGDAPYMANIFSGPSHILPAPTVVFSAFMRSIIKANE